MKLLFLIVILAGFTLVTPAQEKPDDGIDEEKVIKVFLHLLDGESAARLHLADLRRVAAATPYQPLVVVGVSHKLLVWGWKVDEAKAIIKACANAGAGIGADDEGFAKIALFVGRLTDAEESSYAALSNLEDVGIPSWQITAKKVGKSVEEVKSLSLQRRLKQKVLVELLIVGFNEMYAGAAEREARKVNGETPPSPASTPALPPKTCFQNGVKAPCP